MESHQLPAGWRESLQVSQSLSLSVCLTVLLSDLLTEVQRLSDASLRLASEMAAPARAVRMGDEK